MFTGMLRIRRRKHLATFGLVCIIMFLLYEIHQLRNLDSPEDARHDVIPEDQLYRNSDKFKSQNLSKNSKKKSKSSDADDIAWELIEKYRLVEEDRLPIDVSPWQVAEKWVNPREIIPDYVPELVSVLKAMASEPVIHADIAPRGTQLKLLLTLKGGQKVLFKPKWFERDQVIAGQPYAGQDRHNGEIAAFHLSRILGFRKTPIAVGRYLNLEKEVISNAAPRLLETFFMKDNNTCFYGKCYYCKGKESGACGKKHVMEGTVVLWISHKMQLFRHPWSRTYVQNKKAKWEVDEKFCDKVLQIDMYKGPGVRLLDIVDTAIFDYLIGNADRHHYEIFQYLPDSMLIMLDNGKSFGNPYHDERSILAPLYQCCLIRWATFERLRLLRNGVLSKVLESILSFDPISPVLTTLHLRALDRRVTQVMLTLTNCIKHNGQNKVFMEVDGQGIGEKHIDP